MYLINLTLSCQADKIVICLYMNNNKWLNLSVIKVNSLQIFIKKLILLYILINFIITVPSNKATIKSFCNLIIFFTLFFFV